MIKKVDFPKFTINEKHPIAKDMYILGCRFGGYSYDDEFIAIFLRDFADKTRYSECGTTEHKLFGTKELHIKVAKVLQHEYMHHLLYKEHGINAGITYDNLKNDVRIPR